jgi:hypothetical protein
LTGVTYLRKADTNMFHKRVLAAITAALALAACTRTAGPNPAPTTVDTAGAPASTNAAAPPLQNCGVNLAADAVVNAANSVPPAVIGNQPWVWNTKPFAGNYNPCATLSVAVVSLARGTGSSPRTALMFHHGVFVGTATPQPRGFTRFDARHSTDDTVVLEYDTPGKCDACQPAATASVRFQWQGDHVAMLDQLPAIR